MYVTLRSSSSLRQYPDNRGGCFTVQLKDAIHLNARYEVALSEVIYCKNWSSIQSEENFIIFNKIDNYDELENELHSLNYLNNYLHTPLNKGEFYITLFINEEIDNRQTLESKDNIENIDEFVNALNKTTLEMVKNNFAKWTITERYTSLNIHMQDNILQKIQNSYIELSPKLAALLNTQRRILPLETVDGIFKFTFFQRWTTNPRLFQNWQNTEMHSTVLNSHLTNKKINLPTEFYAGPQELVARLQQKIIQHEANGITVDLLSSGHVSLSYNTKSEHEWSNISISTTLATILGFTQKQMVDAGGPLEISNENNITQLPKRTSYKPKWKYVGDQKANITNFAESICVYTDIIQPQLMGDDWGRIIRIIPSVGSPNKTTAVTFSKPHYVPLAYFHINSISIRLFNSNSNVVIPIESEVIVKLHFRERKTYK